MWLVDTALSAQGIWNKLESHVDKNDLLVARFNQFERIE